MPYKDITKRRECAARYGRKHYQENKSWLLPKLREAGRTRRITQKKEMIEAYGGKCSCCGEHRWELLTAEHKNGGGRKHREELGFYWGGPAFYAWLKKQGYPPEYTVLCYNCNCSKGKLGYCPHEREPR